MNYNELDEFSIALLKQDISQFQLLFSTGPIQKSIPIARHLEAEQWGDSSPDKVAVLKQCCSELNVDLTQLTHTEFIDWRSHYKDTTLKLNTLFPTVMGG